MLKIVGESTDRSFSICFVVRTSTERAPGNKGLFRRRQHRVWLAYVYCRAMPVLHSSFPQLQILNRRAQVRKQSPIKRKIWRPFRAWLLVVSHEPRAKPWVYGEINHSSPERAVSVRQTTPSYFISSRRGSVHWDPSGKRSARGQHGLDSPFVLVVVLVLDRLFTDVRGRRRGRLSSRPSGLKAKPASGTLLPPPPSYSIQNEYNLAFVRWNARRRY